MLNIKIDEKYYITFDRMNFILTEKKVHEKGKQAGEEYFDEISYHGNLVSLLNHYVDIMLLNSDCKNFNELYIKLAEIQQTILVVNLNALNKRS